MILYPHLCNETLHGFCRAKLKCTKMRHYHKELCKREQQAKARNLELLRNVESLVSNAKEFSIDYSVLHHLKVKPLIAISVLTVPAYDLRSVDIFIFTSVFLNAPY